MAVIRRCIQKAKTPLKSFSTSGKVLFIILLFVLISLVLALMIHLQGSIFDGVRAYVRGEGLWAKAQKDAVLHLERYSHTRDSEDYNAFTEAILVNIGDRNARMALSASPPERENAAKGFLQGGNDPRDIDALLWFFLNFQSVSYMHDAIEIWTRADAKIDELIVLGSMIENEVKAGGSSLQRMGVLRRQLHALNEELFALENRFSTVLGEGARWVRQTFWSVTVVMLLLFIGIGVFVSRQIIRGITRSERALRASESRFKSLRESDTIGIVSWRMDGSFEDANTHFLTMLGYNEEDMQMGRLNWKELTPVEMRHLDEKAVAQLLERGCCDPFEKAFLHKEGYPVPVYLGASLLNGERERGIAFVMDLSERKKSEEQMRLAATVFDASNDGILITDDDMRIVSANPALCAMTGYTLDTLVGRTPAVLQSGYTGEEVYSDIRSSLAGAGHWQGDIIDRMEDGSLLPLHVSISRVTDTLGKVSHYVAIMSDITERKAREEHLHHIAHHDTLTGLPNRVLFNDRMEQLLRYAARNAARFAVLFFDLDHFKPVNDRFGHEVGDLLLKCVAQRLKSKLRETDTVTRMGGDEFVILLEEVKDRASVELLVAKTVEAVCTPCTIKGHAIDIGVSVGMAIYPEDGRDAAALLHHADSGMYAMKKSGGKER